MTSGTKHSDVGLETLVDLNGSILEQDAGYWVKIDARHVEPSAHAPHAIRYSLTLHDRQGNRVLGYDNAHWVRPLGKYKFSGQRMPYDHKHRTASDNGVPYEFESAQRLLADFFAEADRVIKEALE